MNNQIFVYKGAEICFQTEGDSVMVNATEMARPFGKRPVDFLRTNSASEFIETMSAVRKCTPPDLVIVRNGGSDFGTWMHEDIALEFARWLSPAFAIWCNDRIKELLKHGITAMPQTIDSILADPDNAIRVLTELKESRQRAQSLEKKVELLEETAKDQAPKVLFADAVATSDKSILIGEFAKILNQNDIEIGQNRLYIWLRQKGYLGVRGDYYNMPTQKAMELGLFEIKETTINQPGGKVLISRTSKVTGRGQVYFVNKFIYNKTHPL